MSDFYKAPESFICDVLVSPVVISHWRYNGILLHGFGNLFTPSFGSWRPEAFGKWQGGARNMARMGKTSDRRTLREQYCSCFSASTQLVCLSLRIKPPNLAHILVNWIGVLCPFIWWVSELLIMIRGARFVWRVRAVFAVAAHCVIPKFLYGYIHFAMCHS